jgi:phosphoglycolate phosphatase-like HAD superfamily hydrolase
VITDLIWDAGGTLFDTYPAVVAACQEALGPLAEVTDPDWLMMLFRQRTSYALRSVAETYDLDIDAFTARYREAYAASDPALQPPFPFVAEVCELIVARGGQNFIATHRARASLVRLLEAHGLRSRFTDCITKDDPYPRKPDPASILALIARYDLDPRRCLAIGDRELDVVAGVRAGVWTCFFGEGAHETPADLEISGYDKLLCWLRVGSTQGRYYNSE